MTKPRKTSTIVSVYESNGDKFEWSDWVIEEMAEFLAARNDAERLDAILDALGILLLMLCEYSPLAITTAYQKYLYSQAVRGRTAGPHQYAMADAIDNLTNRSTPESRLSYAKLVLEAKRLKVSKTLRS